MALATYPGYLFELRDLRRACAHRSVLVATGRRGAERRAWDERAAALALPVARRRQEMTLALGAGLHGAAASILPEAGAVGVRYQSRPPFDPGNETRYLEALNEIFAAQGTVKDRERSGSRMGDLGEAGPERGSPGLQGGGRDDEEGFEATTEAAGAARRPGTGAGGGPGSSRRETPAGPLRDDLVIELEGKDLLRFGSSGQYRSFLTAAALAEMTRLEAVKGEVPVLLLDDVDADLDEGRYRALLESVSGRAQVVAATSKPGLALGGPTGGSPATGGAGGRFEVRAGRIRPMPPA
jgi:recombinational DNA repair ATPase RecF